MTAAETTEGVVDARDRRLAIDVGISVVVQAPAGSGKTGLLVQRFLALLARVERPEAVLAITFTRKAAGEMRRRIVEALRDAHGGQSEPKDEFERECRELARAVLERDAALGWGLLHSPSRLQVFTIDGFSSRVVAGTPLLSRLGSTPAVVDDAQVLYREAVRRTLASAGRAAVGDHLEVLLERYEMGLDRLEEQLVDMLSRRDQWMEGALRSHHDEASWVADVEAAFHTAVAAEVASIAADAEPGLIARIHDIARRSRAAVGQDCAWPTLGGADLLGTEAKSAYAWKQASALLTKKDKLRTRRTKDADVHGSDDALRDDLRDLADDIASLPGASAARWLEALQAAARLPSSCEFSPDGRLALGAFLAVLRHAYTTLWTVFRERREVDHVEIAMGAVWALAPGETLEKLDARLEHILVDEFQDTNVLQCDLLRGLTSGWQEGDGRTLFLVGDPMQSIYRFRKAEVGLFLAARSEPHFLETCRLTSATLSVNFRSTRTLIAWANRTFGALLGDRDDATRSLVAFAPAAPKPAAAEGPEVDFVLWDGGGASTATEADAVEAAGLADWIAREASAWRGRGGDAGAVPIAVLVRARSHALPLLRALERRAPEVRLRAPGLDVLADRMVVTDLEALTRALVHPGDRLSQLAVLRSAWVGLTLGDLARLVEPDVASASSASRVPAVPLLLRDAAAVERVSEDARRRIARWLAVADAARAELSSRSLDVVVRSAWLRLGGPASGPGAARLDALSAEAFFDLLAVRARGGCVDIDDFARALRSTEAPVDADAEVDVEIMTMHKAKGLEFDTVVLPALGRSSGRGTTLPLAMETEPDSGRLRLVAPRGARGRFDADSDKYVFLQNREQRRAGAETLRLLYVAATRARRCLLLSAAAGRLNKDGSPSAGSLLAALEPAIGPADARVAQVARETPAGRRTMTRLPADFALATSPQSVADRSVTAETPSAAAGQAPLHFAGSKKSAHVGTVYHAYMQQIAAEGLSAWPAGRIRTQRAAIARSLRREGVLAGEMDESVARVMAAIDATIEDERGRWILSAHEDARSEWAVLAYRQRRLISAVLDRSFVADGARWIVDFKTGRLEIEVAAEAAATGQLATDRLAADKCAQYVPQLSRYRDLLRGSAQAGAAPIRLALFFPEWPAGQRWQDITDLVDAAEAAAAAAAAAPPAA